MRDLALQEAIDKAGGGNALGEALGITAQAISQWSRCPAERVLGVEKASGVPRTALRPDLYPVESVE